MNCNNKYIFPSHPCCWSVRHLIQRSEPLVSCVLVRKLFQLPGYVILALCILNRFTVNNNFFWSQVRWLTKDFHEWQSHEWKSFSHHTTSDQISLFMETTALFSFWHVILCLEHTIPLIITIDCSFSQLLPRTLFFDSALWRHHSWSVKSCKREVLALWHHIHRLFLHVQIDAKAISTSEYQLWISISHHPVFKTWHVSKSIP